LRRAPKNPHMFEVDGLLRTKLQGRDPTKCRSNTAPVGEKDGLSWTSSSQHSDISLYPVGAHPS
jgi:hypothetical protein